MAKWRSASPYSHPEGVAASSTPHYLSSTSGITPLHLPHPTCPAASMGHCHSVLCPPLCLPSMLPCLICLPYPLGGVRLLGALLLHTACSCLFCHYYVSYWLKSDLIAVLHFYLTSDTWAFLHTPRYTFTHTHTVEVYPFTLHCYSSSIYLPAATLLFVHACALDKSIHTAHSCVSAPHHLVDACRLSLAVLPAPLTHTLCLRFFPHTLPALPAH